MGTPRFKIDIPREVTKPMGRETHVAYFLMPHQFENGDGRRVAAVGKPLFVTRCVVKVTAFEPHSHHGNELRRGTAARHTLPEPVTHWMVPEPDTGVAKITMIELQVFDFLEADRQQPMPEFGGCVGKCQQGPREQLGCLHFMVQKGVKHLGAACRVLQSPASRCLDGSCNHLQLRRPLWMGQSSRRGILFPFL